MRKRSGAIHCESEEEYIRLSILSDKKLGIFYESSESSQPNQNIKLAEISKLWNSFDYDQTKQADIDLDSIEMEQIQTLNFMILYEDHLNLGTQIRKAVRRLADCEDPQAESPRAGPLDLVMRQQNRLERKLITKFWISLDSGSPLIKSYCQHADVIVNMRILPIFQHIKCDNYFSKPHTKNESFELQNLECIQQQLDEFFKNKLTQIRQLADKLHYIVA